MRKRLKTLVKKSLGILVAVSMVAPSGAPLVAYGAEAMGNVQRKVSFSRPSALKLSDVGISDAGGSRAGSGSEDGGPSAEDSGAGSDSAGGGSAEAGGNAEAGGSSETGGNAGGSGGETSDDGSGESGAADSGEEGTAGEDSGTSEDEGTSGEEAGETSQGEGTDDTEEGTTEDEETGSEETGEDASDPGDEDTSSPSGEETGSSTDETQGSEDAGEEPADPSGEEEGGEVSEPSEPAEQETPDTPDEETGIGSESSGGSGGSGSASGNPGAVDQPSTAPEVEEVPEDKENTEEDLASPSDALRAPEIFYEEIIDEPDGELVQFEDSYRTYETGEGEYTTVFGGYSGLYRTEDGEIEEIDNTFRDLDEEKLEKAQDENLVARLRMALLPSVYKNEEGPYQVAIPKTMKNGITLQKDGYTLRILPTGGDFGRSMASENAVRYSDVYEGVDFQYTLVGNSLKEDIILLEPGTPYTFEYELGATGLKLVQDGNRILAYDEDKSDPVFVISAPVMIDADGETSGEIELSFDRSEKTMTVTADEDWLADEERAYPVRIDPGAFEMIPSEFFYANVASGTPGQYYGDNGNAFVGYDPVLKNCRVFVGLDTRIAEIMGQTGIVSAEFKVGSQTNNGAGTSVINLYAPMVNWNATTLTWSSMPTQAQMGSSYGTQVVEGVNSILTYDVTQAVEKWVSGQQIQAGFTLVSQLEPSDAAAAEGKYYPVENLHNKTNATYGPQLRVSWEGELVGTDLETLPIDSLTANVGAAIEKTGINGRNAVSVIAYGLSQAGSEVSYELLEEDGETEEPADGPVTAANKANTPDYAKAAEEVQGNAIAIFEKNSKDGNWQSEAMAPLDGLDLDTIYRVAAKAVGKEIVDGQQSDEEAESPVVYTDDFLLYEIQYTDVMTRIAQHYGVSVNQLNADNFIGTNLNEAGTILFIRNPETSEAYTYIAPGIRDQYLIDSFMNGVDFRFPMCGEPINMISGNFYVNQTDAEVEDLGGTFGIERSYNGKTPYFRSEFGMGWNSPFGERIMVLENGAILYTDGTGRSMQFTKQADGTYAAPEGYEMVLRPVDSVDVDMDYGTEEEASPSNAASEETAAMPVSYGSYHVTNLKRASASNASDATSSDAEEEAGEVPSSAGWELEEADGTVHIFNAMGLLAGVKDRQGHATKLTYDGAYQLVKVTSPSGKEFSIETDEDARITEIGLPDGGKITYTYDEAGDLVQVTNPEGDTRKYVYDDSHHMTEWYDENGNRMVLNVYDSEGRVTKQTDALGGVSTIDYQDGQTIFTDNRGNDTVYEYDDQYRVTAVRYADGTSELSTYTEDNFLASKTDANGVTTTYTYDENGNVLTETRADGSSSSYTYNELNLPLTATDYEGNTTSFTYDEAGNLLSMTDGAGNTTTYVYDDLSRLVSMTDANGGTTTFAYEGNEAVPSSMTDGEGNTTILTYDEMNRVLTQTDGEGNTTAHTYNANGWEISTTAADGGETVYEFSPAGEVLSITDPMGVRTDFTYDAQHNILSGTDALGHTLTYEYDENYNKIKETDAKGNETLYSYDVRNRLIQGTDALGHTTSLTLDGNGNILVQQDKRGNETQLTYDEVLGLPTWTTDRTGASIGYSYDRNGNLTGVSYPDGSSVSYTYDGAGRMISMTAQNGLVTELSYDGNGNIVRITDDESRVYTYEYNHNNQVVRATDPLGGVTEYAYDRAGNQVSVTDANGNTTGYAYDAVGRLTEVQDALDGVVSTAYNLNGNMTSTTDQNGHSSSYYYDVLGQLTAQTDGEGNVTALEYDPIGLVSKVTDALKGETEYEADALGQTVKMIDALDGEYLYEYDANGNVVKITYPDGDTVTMEYDAEDRMISSTDEAGVVTTYTYDSMGRIRVAEDNIGNTMSYEYDSMGNLVKQTDTIGREAIYEYDMFGRLVSMTGTDGATTTYTYDALDRLTGVVQADLTRYAYEYDAVGNLIQTTEPGEAVYTYTYDAINRLTKKVDPLGAATTFQYDAKGNLTGSIDAEGAITAYQYDAIDRLTQFTDGRGNETLYEYDELSRLIGYTTPEGGREEYRYDALGNLTKYKDANGLITEYQYDPMGNVLTAISPKGAKTGYTYDKHDEVTSITDAEGNVTRYEVDLNRLVTKMTAKNGGEYTYAYDAVHRLTNVTSPLGLSRELTYDTADNVVKDTDNLGRTNTYEYDIMHRMLKSTNAKGGVAQYTYDLRGNQAVVKDENGYAWNYVYDLMDQLTLSVDPEGKATEIAYNLVGEVSKITQPGDRVTRYLYDDNYNVTGVTNPRGYFTEYTYDKDNRETAITNGNLETTQIAYDPGNRITGITDRMGLTESYEYDGHGNTTAVTATNGLVTRFDYDILDNLIGVTLPSGLKTSYGYDVMGNVTSVTDTMGQITNYTYDLEGNMTSLTDTMGRTETMTYDPAGRLITHTSNGGNRIKYDYDVLNSLVEKTYEDDKNHTIRHEGVVYGYDVMGQRTSMMDQSGATTYQYDGLGRITETKTGSGEVTQYVYGENDEIERIVYPDGKSVRYEYDKNNNLTKVIDRTGRETTYVYDSIDRVREIHRPNGISTYNTFNARDQITELVNKCDDCGFVISRYEYTYDDRGFISSEKATETLYDYQWDYRDNDWHGGWGHDWDDDWHDWDDDWHGDWHDDWEDWRDDWHKKGDEGWFPHGQMHLSEAEAATASNASELRMDGRGKDDWMKFHQTTTKRVFTYDADGKLLTSSESWGPFAHVDYEFAYDDMGNRTSYKVIYNGFLREKADYTYNAANQLTQAKLQYGSKKTTVDYRYDEDGNLVQETGKSGFKKLNTTYVYEVENRLKAVYEQGQLLTAMAYDGDGNRIFQLNYNPYAELPEDDFWPDDDGHRPGRPDDDDDHRPGRPDDDDDHRPGRPDDDDDDHRPGRPDDDDRPGRPGEDHRPGGGRPFALGIDAGEILDPERIKESFAELEESAETASPSDAESSTTSNGALFDVFDQEQVKENLAEAQAKDEAAAASASNAQAYSFGPGGDHRPGGNNRPGGNDRPGEGHRPGGEPEHKPEWKPDHDSDWKPDYGHGDWEPGDDGRQNGILFPIRGEVSWQEAELIGMIGRGGDYEDYELTEYVNDVNCENEEVLMELNINGRMHAAYSYGNERLTAESYTRWTGYYTYDPRGSVSGITGQNGWVLQSYRYSVNGEMTFGKPRYDNVYGYNAESYNPNTGLQYLRARYYNVGTAAFISEDSYLGDISDPLSLNRYNYTKSNPLNYEDPEGHASNDFYEELSRYSGWDYWKEVAEKYFPELVHTVLPMTDEENPINQTIESVINVKGEIGIGFGGSVSVNQIKVDGVIKRRIEKDIKGNQVVDEVEELVLTLPPGVKLGARHTTTPEQNWEWSLDNVEALYGIEGYTNNNINAEDTITYKDGEWRNGDLVLDVGASLYLVVGGGASVEINISELMRKLGEALDNFMGEGCD